MRTATLRRNTKETEIQGKLAIEGRGRYEISTGIRFFDHMLELFTKHGGFDLTLQARGDLVFDANGGFYFTDHGKRRPREAKIRSRNQVHRASPWLRTGPTPSVSSRIAARRATYASAESSATFNPNARAIWDGASHTLRPANAR